MESTAESRLTKVGCPVTRIYDTGVWKRLRLVILSRDGYRCTIPLKDGSACPRPATQVDHIRPISEGGAPYDPSNLRAACGHCNRRINAERRAELSRIALGQSTSRRWW
jgi:5-methylcytosine-specific restriction enzyme A